MLDDLIVKGEKISPKTLTFLSLKWHLLIQSQPLALAEFILPCPSSLYSHRWNRAKYSEVMATSTIKNILKKMLFTQLIIKGENQEKWRETSCPSTNITDGIATSLVTGEIQIKTTRCHNVYQNRQRQTGNTEVMTRMQRSRSFRALVSWLEAPGKPAKLCNHLKKRSAVSHKVKNMFKMMRSINPFQGIYTSEKKIIDTKFLCKCKHINIK